MKTRRQVLAGAAVMGFPAITSARSPNGLLHFGAIGCSRQGWKDVSEICRHPKVRLVAAADVDADHFKEVEKAFSGTPTFADFREMLAAHPEIDAVNVSTPDHTHATIAMEAMRQGKHVYCEKPLTHTVWEARQMAKLAAAKGVVTRMGNQIHSLKQYRIAKEVVQSGVIGKVRSVFTWISALGHGRAKVLRRPQHTPPVPASLNWDLWVGPAPMRPYGGGVYHPFAWRDWQDFGSGSIGDNGCHLFDPIFTALDLGAPLSLRNDHSGMNEEIWPASQTIAYRFPGTEWTAADVLPVTWYDGGKRPGLRLKGTPKGHDLTQPASILVGEGGNLLVPHWGFPELFPKEDFASFQWPNLGDLNHWHGWVEACLEGNTAVSDNFAYAGPLTEAVQLGNVAARFPGEELRWDPEGLRITNRPEANPYLTKEYRKGWEIEEVPG